MIRHKTEVTPQDPTASDTTEGERPRVLLVDDQPARLLTYESVLEGVGVQCVRALSGKEALARMLQDGFALILLDVSMPVMDGFETARLIRQHPRFELTPIIFITGVNVTQLDTLRGYEAGAIDCISVPIVPEILRSKVALLVELYRRRRELETLNCELSAAHERLRAERNSALAGAEARWEKEWLAAVLNGISDEVYFTDTEGRHTYANPAAMREFGSETVRDVKPTDILTWLEVLLPDGSPRSPEEAPPLRALRGEIVRNEEEVVRNPRTGELRHRQVSSAPVRGAQESIIGAVTVVRDLTEMRAREQQLRRIEQEHALLEISSDAIFLWELDGTIQYWNRGAAELYGFGSDEAVGRISHELLSTVHPDGIHHIVEHLRQHGSWRGELTHRTRSRAVLTVQSSMQAVLRGGRTFIMESNRDLTARKRNEDLLREADRRKDEFLAVLSHELRNPLAPIRNVAEYLNLCDSSSEPRLDWARRVLHRQVTHMSRILDDLLDMTRITSGRLLLKKRPVPLNEVLEAAIETTRQLIDEKEHRLVVDVPSILPMLDGDPVRLTQVVSNLLANSAKYTDRGGLIELTAREEQRTLYLCVKDNGTGIPPEHIPRLFTMFAQAPGARDRSEGGLGIGLALAKGIVELHGGTIEGKSGGPGSGSEFQIRLPLLESNPAFVGASEEPPERQDAKLRILIADDNQDAADSLALLLRLEHHEVRVAHDGRAALSLAQTFRPNVLLLDIGMPELDGYEVARALREQPSIADMCLIALTGRGRQEDERQAIQAGFDFHLRKPCDLNDLRRTIAAHRSRSETTR